MLFETSADGEFFALPADASRGEFGGYDHETGTGLYKFVSYTSGASLVIERNDDCWQKEALRRQESQANVGGGHTQEFLVDDEWQGRLSLCNTAGGHTPENMLKWWQHAVDNACTMGLSKYHTIQARYEYVEICCKKIIVAHCHHGLCGSDHFSIVFSCPVSPPKLFWAAGLPLRILNG